MMNQSPATAPLSRRSLVLSAAGAVIAATCAPLAGALAGEVGAGPGAASATTVAGSGTETHAATRIDPMSILPAGVPAGGGSPARVAYTSCVMSAYYEVVTPEYMVRIPYSLDEFDISYSEDETSAVVADGSVHATAELVIRFRELKRTGSLAWKDRSRAAFRFFCLPQGSVPNEGLESPDHLYARYHPSDVATSDGRVVWVATTTFEPSECPSESDLWFMARMVAGLPEGGGPVAVYPAEGGSVVATPYYSLTVPAAPEALTVLYSEESSLYFEDPVYAHRLSLSLSDDPYDALEMHCIPDGGILEESYPVWIDTGVYVSDGLRVIMMALYEGFPNQVTPEEAASREVEKSEWLDAIARTVQAL